MMRKVGELSVQMQNGRLIELLDLMETFPQSFGGDDDTSESC